MGRAGARDFFLTRFRAEKPVCARERQFDRDQIVWPPAHEFLSLASNRPVADSDY